MSKITRCAADYEPFVGERVHFELEVPTPYAPGVILDEIRRVVNRGLRQAMRDARAEYDAADQPAPTEDAEPD